jgi:hypothetical protein
MPGHLSWEAESVETLRDFPRASDRPVSRNEHFAVENREGFARPSGVPQEPAAGSR